MTTPSIGKQHGISMFASPKYELLVIPVFLIPRLPRRTSAARDCVLSNPFVLTYRSLQLLRLFTIGTCVCVCEHVGQRCV